MFWSLRDAWPACKGLWGGLPESTAFKFCGVEQSTTLFGICVPSKLCHWVGKDPETSDGAIGESGSSCEREAAWRSWLKAGLRQPEQRVLILPGLVGERAAAHNSWRTFYTRSCIPQFAGTCSSRRTCSIKLDWVHACSMEVLHFVD